MNWETHCKITERKVVAGQYALNTVKHLLPSNHLATIYFALIHSHLTYGCILWGNTQKRYLHKIKVSQKKAIHIICQAKYSSQTAPPFKKKNILQFENRYNVLLSEFMYKVHKNIPVSLH